jgi:O-acetylserine/cysteine efflux transporter
VPLRDRLLALLVAVVWGVNFPATAIALEHFPPLLMVALRFTLIAIPTLLLVPRPQVPVRWLVGVGLGIGVIQFGFLYLGMAAGMPSGLASLVLQASAPFTVLIAGIWLHERLSRRQAIGIGIAVAGLIAIAVHRAQIAAALPVILTLCAALGWAIGNICSRQARAPKPLHLTLWMSVVAPIPMFALSWLVEGPDRIGASLGTVFTRAALPAVLGLAYIVVLATLVGYGLWNSLLSRHPSSVVAPFSMMVPVAGVLSSWLFFDEIPDVVELAAGVAVIAGVLYSSLPALSSSTGSKMPAQSRNTTDARGQPAEHADSARGE